MLAGRLWAQVGDFDKAEKALEVAREKADGVKEQITALEASCALAAHQLQEY